jgi:hypothetical protein
MSACGMARFQERVRHQGTPRPPARRWTQRRCPWRGACQAVGEPGSGSDKRLTERAEALIAGTSTRRDPALHRNAQAGVIPNRCRILVQLGEAAP